MVCGVEMFSPIDCFQSYIPARKLLRLTARNNVPHEYKTQETSQNIYRYTISLPVCELIPSLLDIIYCFHLFSRVSCSSEAVAATPLVSLETPSDDTGTGTVNEIIEVRAGLQA